MKGTHTQSGLLCEIEILETNLGFWENVQDGMFNLLFFCLQVFYTIVLSAGTIHIDEVWHDKGMCLLFQSVKQMTFVLFSFHFCCDSPLVCSSSSSYVSTRSDSVTVLRSWNLSSNSLLFLSSPSSLARIHSFISLVRDRPLSLVLPNDVVSSTVMLGFTMTLVLLSAFTVLTSILLIIGLQGVSWLFCSSSSSVTSCQRLEETVLGVWNVSLRLDYFVQMSWQTSLKSSFTTWTVKSMNLSQSVRHECLVIQCFIWTVDVIHACVMLFTCLRGISWKIRIKEVMQTQARKFH